MTRFSRQFRYKVRAVSEYVVAQLMFGVSRTIEEIHLVKNKPSSVDYYRSGKELFDFSWNVITELLTTFDEAEYYGVDPDEVSDAYWKAATRSITTALSVTQQGVEFILKGKIAEISPYLLISDNPRSWPSPYDRNDIEFSEFRTIDAQDLIRTHDTFSDQAFSGEFIERFNFLREQRNKLMHSVDKNIEVSVAQVVDAILYMHTNLFPNESWPKVRLQFLRQSPTSEFGSWEVAVNRVCWETELAIKHLTPKQVKDYFNIDKKQRAYYCPKCLDDANTKVGFEQKLARLTSKTSDANELYCPICDDKFDVTREDCGDESCLGNVICESGTCLTCSI